MSRAKPQGAPPGERQNQHPNGGRVDLLYLAYNRLEFTRETFSALLAHTDWSLIRQLCVYDDGSVDGTREWLEDKIQEVPAPTEFRRTRLGSPVLIMNDFIRASTAPILGKLDNDAMVPPGWLNQSLAVVDRHPELTLLGLEAMHPHNADAAIQRTYKPSSFIGGLGLFRRRAFARSLPTRQATYFGFPEWQVAQGRSLCRGWIIPALPVFLLDRIPFQPWRGYSDHYIAKGWQRGWGNYQPHCTLWAWWKPDKISPPPPARPVPPAAPRLRVPHRRRQRARRQLRRFKS